MYIAFLAALCFACYRRPVAGDFDRYIYEALVRGRYQTFEAVYPIVKHSNPRAEESSVLDSAVHLGQLEPLYAIKPLYVEAIGVFAFTGASIQARINLISAVSLFGIGVVVLVWTGQSLYSALLLLTPGIFVLGRMGTPDALSTLVLVAGVYTIIRNPARLLPGVLLLLISIWIRTDNVLFVAASFLYLLGRRRMKLRETGVLFAVACGSVIFVNHFAGNYGWRVLFQYSFLGGRSPADVVPHFGPAQYVTVAMQSAETLFPQIAIWALLGLVTWRWSGPDRGWLAPVWAAAAVHFALYPSPESRYLVWAFVLTGILFIVAIAHARFPGTTGS
jgi:hypothetical protein